VVANGLTGVQSGGTAAVTIGQSIVSDNTVGIAAVGGGSLLSVGNNQITANMTNGSFSGSSGLQ
jgi:hypothetical protein